MRDRQSLLKAVVFAAALAGIWQAAPDASQLFRRGESFKTFTSADLSIDYRDGDNWQQARGAGNVLAFFTRQPDTSVIISKTPLDPPLSQEDIGDLFAKLESDVVKGEVPDAKDLTSAVVSHPTLGRMVRIEYSRPSATVAKPPIIERVRQFTIPSGAALYRILFSARTANFKRDEATFQRMLDSLRLTPAKGPQP